MDQLLFNDFRTEIKNLFHIESWINDEIFVIYTYLEDDDEKKKK